MVLSGPWVQSGAPTEPGLYPPWHPWLTGPHLSLALESMPATVPLPSSVGSALSLCANSSAECFGWLSADFWDSLSVSVNFSCLGPPTRLVLRPCGVSWC